MFFLLSSTSLVWTTTSYSSSTYYTSLSLGCGRLYSPIWCESYKQLEEMWCKTWTNNTNRSSLLGMGLYADSQESLGNAKASREGLQRSSAGKLFIAHTLRSLSPTHSALCPSLRACWAQVERIPCSEIYFSTSPPGTLMRSWGYTQTQPLTISGLPHIHWDDQCTCSSKMCAHNTTRPNSPTKWPHAVDRKPR
jgi:hypothetical protein